ncbi:MAG: hypothetical protein JOZ38_03410 [Candidatus Eremiobacteraeota bacterium]|nr:hypothetical protein [Candidatus Eremiobacteraeota bacterium]
MVFCCIVSRAWGVIPLSFFACAAGEAALLRFAPARFAPDLRQPLVIATSWGGYGAWMWLVAALCIGFASIAYVRTVRNLAAERSEMRVTAIAATAAASLLGALLCPVTFSSDVYAYGAYGLMAAVGLNPYDHVHLTTFDPLVTAAIWQWSNPLPACVYGPAFVWIAAAIVSATHGFGVTAQLFSLKVLACSALLACVPLAAAAFGKMPRGIRFAAAAGIALNPVILWTAAEGHNDALMLAVALSGFILLRRFGTFAGTFAVALSTLVKFPGIAAAAGIALWNVSNRARFTQALGAIALGSFVTVASAWPFLQTASFRGHGPYAPQASPQFVVATLLAPAAGARAPLLAAAIVGLVCAAVAIAGCRAVFARDASGYAVLGLAAWYALPNPYPWYALWVLPAVFLAPQTRAGRALWIATLAIFIRYLFDVSNPTPAAGFALALAAFAPPLVALRYGQRKTALEPPGKP